MKKIIILLCIVFSSQIYAQRSQKPWDNQPNYKNELQKDVKKSLNLKHLAKYFEKDNQNIKNVEKQTSSVQNFPFVNGINIAWINFGRDTGVDPFNGSQYHPELNQFGRAMDFVKSNGGNVMRWWYHTNGSTNPVYDQNQKVAPNPSFFHEDVRDILDLAQSKGIKVQICLWSFDMLKDQWGADAAANKKLLTQSDYTSAYINNALLPLVNAIGNHPALYAWEIFNEPEGMTNEYASHWPGFKEKITMQDIQRFVNKTSGAIRRAQPNVKITNGALGFLTNVEDAANGFWNAYSDANLRSVGGDQDGYLDFYNIHYYSWARSKGSPFHNNYDVNKIDKATVIGEYYPDDLSFGSQGGDNDHNLPTIPSVDLGTTIVDRGWHGTLIWSWTDRSSSSERNRMATIMRNVSINEPSPPVDEVAFNNAPTTISPQRSYTFNIDYKASTNREIIVEFWSANNWLGEQAETVSAGSGTQSVTVTLPSEPSPGSGYFYKTYIRPVGTTWQQAIDRDQVDNVTVTNASTVDEVAFNNAPTSISPQQSYTFTIDYKATVNREIVVEFWSANSWLGEQTETVSAGSGTQPVTVNLPNEPSPGSGYFYKAYIRPVGTTWQEAIHRDQVDNVTVTSGITVDEVAFNNAPTSISPQRSYTFTIDYKAKTTREVVVEFWSPSSWLGEHVETVSEGSGTQSVTVTLPSEPSPGSGYFYKAHIRPLGTTYEEALFRDQVDNVTVRGSQLIPNGTYYLTSTQSNQRMRSRSRESHSAVMRNPSNYYYNQRWIFNHLGDNVYTIKNRSTNRYLEVRDARCTNGGNVMTWTSANDDHQKWKVVTNGSGTYSLKPMHCQQLALDRDGGRRNANVHVWEFDASNNNQKWQILPYGSRTRFTKDLMTPKVDESIIVKAYPNPATDFVQLSGIEKGDAVVIYDLQGNVFRDFIAKNSSEVIAIGDLNPGYYVIAVVGKSKLKLIKK